MRIAFYGDSLTDGYPGVSYFKLLQHQFPEDTLLNFGHFNDTASSLHRRIIARRLLRPVDCSFIWVGVNDVIISQSPLFSKLRRWWARDDDEFRIHYRALLDLLVPHAQRVITVSPALIGEIPDSSANAALSRRGEIIADLTTQYSKARFLDLHAAFIDALAGGSSADYRPDHPLQSLFDTILLRQPDAVDRVSTQRGLRLTLDNVHLNSAGAGIVAAEFARLIIAQKRVALNTTAKNAKAK